MDRRTPDERVLDAKIASIMRGDSQPAETKIDDKPVDDWRTLSPDEFRQRFSRQFGFPPHGR